jgi:HD-like signal output (HDOD) protein
LAADGALTVTLDAPSPAEATSENEASEAWWTAAPEAATEIAPAAQLALSPQSAALDRILAGYAECEDLKLPALPKVAERVLRMLVGDGYDAQRVAQEVAGDQVLSMAVLRLANCPLYRGREQVKDLQGAAARLGTNALRTIMLQHSLQAAIKQRRTIDKRLASFVWNGALASATILRGLAPLTGGDGEEAYLVGLLHDIGNVLVLREAQQQEELLGNRIAGEEFVWLCRQHHEALGWLIAEVWELPDKLKAVIANHHRPTDEIATEAGLIGLADMLKAMLKYAPPVAYDLLNSTPAQRLKLTERPEFIAFLDALPDELANIPTSYG